MANDRPKLLIVEDHIPFQERLLEIVKNPPKDWIEGTGVFGFEVDAVDNAKDALDKVLSAKDNKHPYEVIVLDLELPGTKEALEQKQAFQDHGRKLLRDIRSNCITSIVIITGFPTTQNLIYSVRYGADDFFEKPIMDRSGEKTLFTRLILAVGITREKLYREIQQKRALIFANTKGIIIEHYRSRDITTQADIISQKIRNTIEQIKQRYGLDPDIDKDDPICNNLISTLEITNKMLEVLWNDYRKPNKEQNIKEDVDVSILLNEEISHIVPCYLHHQVDLVANDFGGRLVTETVESDIRALIEELLFSALQFSSEGGSVKLNARYNEDKSDIEVSVTYQGKPISDDLLINLKNGNLLIDELDKQFEGIVFLWSLSRNIGVRIDIRRDNNNNTITLIIPVI